MEWKLKINDIEHEVRYYPGFPSRTNGDWSFFIDGKRIAEVPSRFKGAWVVEHHFEIDGEPLVLRGYDHQYDLVYQGKYLKRNTPYKKLLFDWQSVLSILFSLMALPTYWCFPIDIYVYLATSLMTWKGLLCAFSPLRGKWRIPLSVLTCLGSWCVALIRNS